MITLIFGIIAVAVTVAILVNYNKNKKASEELKGVKAARPIDVLAVEAKEVFNSNEEIATPEQQAALAEAKKVNKSSKTAAKPYIQSKPKKVTK